LVLWKRTFAPPAPGRRPGPPAPPPPSRPRVVAGVGVGGGANWLREVTAGPAPACIGSGALRAPVAAGAFGATIAAAGGGGGGGGELALAATAAQPPTLGAVAAGSSTMQVVTSSMEVGVRVREVAGGNTQQSSQNVGEGSTARSLGRLECWVLFGGSNPTRTLGTAGTIARPPRHPLTQTTLVTPCQPVPV
jgi:hypothetical protein